MKKTILILLAFFYSAVSSGAVVKLHYCIEEVVSCNMEHTTSGSSPDECKVVKTPDCCKTKIELVKTDVAKNAELLQLQMASSFALIPDTGYVSQHVLFYPEKLGQDYLSNAPPRLRQLPIFILNCNFRL
ncbi:HYC_CC_PP family protein [Elizabethkingia meningoseptica]|uniref:HYC_CC_PP family protein n=1 Tax=Elizabethkingia meningoseptica TaxID=238 RepID=UPI0038922FE3